MASKPAEYKVEYRPANELKPYARNARTHSEEQIAQIVESMEQFGFTNPILADEFIRAGHGRVRAALRLYALGKTIKLPGGGAMPDGMVPVIDCSSWSDEEKRAYVLVDNKVALNADWDMDLLRLEVGELQSADLALSKMGFTEGELAELLKPPEPDAPQDKANNAIIQFNIVFDDAEQQQAWFAFMRKLKGMYPDEGTLGNRLAKFLTEVDLGALTK